MKEFDLIIVGGGAAGILCAVEADKKGIDNILLIEKDPNLGGALNLGDYNIGRENNITGQEYKKKLMESFEHCKVDLKLNTMVLKIEENNEVLCTSSENGIEKIKGKKIILANGQKEGARKALSMVGDRCSGILTVGMVKKIFSMNMIPGKKILIDGDSTLYMIEQQLLNNSIEVIGIITENDKVKTCGLTSNIYKDYKIVSIQGAGRISSVTLEKDNSQEIVKCDTLVFARPMLSDGLVAMRSDIDLNPHTTGPKVDDNYMTSRDNIYACGNGIYIHKYIEDIEEECIKVIQKLKY